MLLNRVVEYVFFFGLLGLIGLLLWNMFLPFITSLALAAVISVICYPLYEHIRQLVPRHNSSVAALITTLLVIVLVVLPMMWISSLLVTEAVSVYKLLSNGDYSLAEKIEEGQKALESLMPGLQIDIISYLRQGAGWFASNLGSIFTTAASTVFSIFIAMVASFYFFRDGKKFTQEIIRISPLPDKEDTMIIQRMGAAIRGVALGTVFVALIQGVSTAIGLSIFGFERAILLGTLAAIAALVPGIGTPVIFIPTAAYAFFFGDYVAGIGVLVWWLLAVSWVDNILGPYLVSRNYPMHPFLILLSVLGGIFMFGPIGFMVGPVVTSVFIVLLEIYATHIAGNEKEL